MIKRHGINVLKQKQQWSYATKYYDIKDEKVSNELNDRKWEGEKDRDSLREKGCVIY